MTRTRWQTLAALTLAVGAVTYVLADWAVRSGSAPVPVSPAVSVALLLVAAALLALGRSVRRFVQGKRGRMDVLRAFRILVLAKASALAGALQLGFFGALALVAAAMPEAPRADEQAGAAGLAALSCLVLVVAALVVEWLCRVPPDEDGNSQPGGAA